MDDARTALLLEYDHKPFTFAFPSVLTSTGGGSGGGGSSGGGGGGGDGDGGGDAAVPTWKPPPAAIPADLDLSVRIFEQQSKRMAIRSFETAPLLTQWHMGLGAFPFDVLAHIHSMLTESGKPSIQAKRNLTYHQQLIEQRAEYGCTWRARCRRDELKDQLS